MRIRNRKQKLTKNRKPFHKTTRKPGIYVEDYYIGGSNYGKNEYRLYKSKRYKRYIKQRNRKKYNLKQLDKYNKPKLINHCIKCVCTGTGGEGVGDSKGFFYQKCHFCGVKYWERSTWTQMFGRILYFPKDRAKLCHDCSQGYIKTYIIFEQLKNTLYLPNDCWRIIKECIFKNTNSIYKFSTIEPFHCASCNKYIEGSKGNRIKCSTACEILKRMNQFIGEYHI